MPFDEQHDKQLSAMLKATIEFLYQVAIQTIHIRELFHVTRRIKTISYSIEIEESKTSSSIEIFACFFFIALS